MRFHSLFFLFPLLALITLAAPQVAHADITSNLIGHWTFDNTTNDTSGQGNHGTAQGGPSYTTGKINQAMPPSTACSIPASGASSRGDTASFSKGKGSASGWGYRSWVRCDDTPMWNWLPHTAA
jgi:hypothetical protein